MLRDLGIILAISLGILAGLEGILRIIYPEKVQDSNPASNLAYEFDQDFLVRLKPGMSKIYIRNLQDGGDAIRWKTNKDSFRGTDLENDPKFRIIVYGDSNIQARFSERDNTFTGKLDYFLNKSGIADVEIINAGIVGSGPDQSLIRFKKEADKYRPDLVIFHICADNDFGDLVRNRLFSLDKDGNLVSTDHRKTIDAQLLPTEQETYESHLSRLLIVRALNKVTSKFLKKEGKEENWVQSLEKHVAEEYLVYKESRPRQFSHFEDHYDIDIALHPGQESSRTKIRLMESVLKAANNFAREQGIKFLVTIQPSVIDIAKDNSVLNYEYLDMYPDYKRTRLTGAVEKICISNNISCINFFDIFLQNNPADLYFKPGDDHWNDNGQEVAARETAVYIIDNSLLEAQ